MMTKLFSLIIISVLIFSSCKTQENTSIKKEDGKLKLTNTTCKNCRTHGGDYLVFEISYPVEKHDSLKKTNLKLDTYTNSGHNPIDLKVLNYELSKTIDKYILIVNYEDARQKAKKKKITWSIKTFKPLINESW